LNCIGKSAFANTIIGKPFQDTASTIGMSTFSCNLQHIRGKGGASPDSKWNEYVKPDRELEATLAIMASQMDGKQSSDQNGEVKEIIEYDSTLVMKCLASEVKMSSKLILSIFDFGGQSVFNVSEMIV
jgi:hypothetical protein